MKQKFLVGERVKILGHSYYRGKEGVVIYGGLGPIQVRIKIGVRKTTDVFFTSEMLEKKER